MNRSNNVPTILFNTISHRRAIVPSYYLLFLLIALCSVAFSLSIEPYSFSVSSAAMAANKRDLYRADGVRIQHDPYHPEMMEKYGAPGKTDKEGFDPYADSVGAGIYGGRVQRDEDGNVVIGEQYQSHNPRPGPVYAGGGYTPTVRLLQASDLTALGNWLDKHPDLANEVSTGGATPLHMCGMSQRSQLSAALLIERGARIETRDTYDYTPLHRMASNNLGGGGRGSAAGWGRPECYHESGRDGVDYCHSV